jgi:hypothetical protein
MEPFILRAHDEHQREPNERKREKCLLLTSLQIAEEKQKVLSVIDTLKMYVNQLFAFLMSDIY